MLDISCAIDHHKKVIEQLDEMSRKEIFESMPKMNEISLHLVRTNGTHTYDLSWIKGEILFKVQCQDGICVLVRLPKESSE